MLALDTEFVRERTYHAELALIQINDGQAIYLIDTLKVDDLSPLLELITQPTPQLVVHSGREDMEILLNLCDGEAIDVFDTQIAAALCGIDSQAGYARLLNMLFQLDIDKGETRSNWLQRPLSERQLHYAAVDVAHLPALHDYLKRRLEVLGRLDWLSQECRSTFARSALFPDPSQGYKRFNQQQRMSQRQLAVLRALYIWREQLAMENNRPRGHIINNEDLMRLAQKMPADRQQLESLFTAPAVRKRSAGIVEAMAAAMDLPDSELPALEEPLEEGLSRNQSQKLRKAVKQQASQLGIAAPLLANRQTQNQLVRAHILGEPIKLAEDWRKPYLQSALKAL